MGTKNLAHARTGIVLASTAITLDGFIAGPNHEMDWVFDHQFLPEGPIDVVEEMIATTGAILSGRGSFEKQSIGQNRTQRPLPLDLGLSSCARPP